MGEQPPDGKNDENTDAVTFTAKPAKTPPAESSANIRLRTLVILSFWAIIIFLGLPVWLWTTSVYRARLPLQDMWNWAHGKVNLQAAGEHSVADPFAGLQAYIPLTDSH